MAGLRERKKQRTRHQLVAVADELFGNQGYLETSIEQIAEQAEVSVGTVYNYFQSKADILAALLDGAVSEAVDLDRPLSVRANQTPERALNGVVRHFYAVMGKYDRRLMVHALGLLVSQSDRYMDMNQSWDQKLEEHFQDVVNTLIENGSLASDTDSALLASTLFNIASAEFRKYTYGIRNTVAAAKKATAAQFELLLRACDAVTA